MRYHDDHLDIRLPHDHPLHAIEQTAAMLFDEYICGPASTQVIYRGWVWRYATTVPVAGPVLVMVSSDN